MNIWGEDDNGNADLQNTIQLIKNKYTCSLPLTVPGAEMLKSTAGTKSVDIEIQDWALRQLIVSSRHTVPYLCLPFPVLEPSHELRARHHQQWCVDMQLQVSEQQTLFQLTQETHWPVYCRTWERNGPFSPWICLIALQCGSGLKQTFLDPFYAILRGSSLADI